MCAGTTRTPASAKGSKVGDLMVEGTYIFDCEVFAYDWLFDFKDVVTGEHISIWNDNDAVIAFMERDPFLGGFNNKHYDNFILKAVMCGFTPEEVKKVNDLIIQEELSGWDIPSLKEYRVFFDSFDLRDDCQDGISLKAIEAHLGIPIEETGVDFNIDRPLTESERRRTEYYCRYDVDATEILWKLRQGYLDNKVAVGAKRGLTDRKAMYMTNAKLTSVYLQAEKPEKPWTDDILSLLINAYRKGVQAASEMLAYDLTVDVRSMDEVIYLVIDGKTFEDRVADHVLSGDLQGLQTLAESEFHRVYNAAVLDGGHQYQSSVGYGVTKNWYTVMDDKVRETHRYLEGASVSLDEEFWTFDGDHAAYPGGFTKAENNVNCRCTVELHIDAEEE